MMMRKQYLSATALAVFGAWGMSTSQENGDLNARLEKLETKLTAVETYLGNQAKSAESVAGALDASEKAGFAHGINPESRRILLEAWRAQTKAAASNVPGADQKQAEGPERNSRRELAQK